MEACLYPDIDPLFDVILELDQTSILAAPNRDDEIAKPRPTEEQSICALRQAESDTPVADVCRQLTIVRSCGMIGCAVQIATPIPPVVASTERRACSSICVGLAKFFQNRRAVRSEAQTDDLCAINEGDGSSSLTE
jgi:hypothetical protein